MLKPASIPTDIIIVPIGRTEPDPAVVDRLVESMGRIGLLNPITVQRYAGGLQWVLIAGRTRLEAAPRLRWETIPAFELPEMKSTPDAEIIGKLAEISENVDRGNLTAARRCELIRQYVALLREHDELLKGLSAHGEPKVDRLGRKGAHRPKSPTAHAAEKFGVGKSTVKRALAEPRKAPEPIVDHSGVPGGRAKRMKAGLKPLGAPPTPRKRRSVLDRFRWGSGG